MKKKLFEIKIKFDGVTIVNRKDADMLDVEEEYGLFKKKMK